MTNKTADIIYSKMLDTTVKDVALTALRIMDRVQDCPVADQLLGLASILICMLNHYDLDHVDVLGIADNMVYSGENNNMRMEFKAIKDYMKNEWEI